MKACFKCGVVKELSEFYAHSAMGDGHLGKCKDCTKSDVAKRYAEKAEEIRDYDRRRNTQPSRIENNRKYSRTTYRRHKVKMIAKQREDRIKNKDKYIARTMVGNAVRDKRLSKMPCEICGNHKSEAHHEDYAKPMEVKWLCRIHHAQLHRKHKHQSPQCGTSHR